MKEELRAIVAADLAVPEDREARDIAQAAFAELGSTDPELRDELAYRVLGGWITGNALEPDDVRALLVRALEGIQNGLGDREGDGVFGRSFALLIVAAALYRDNREPFLADRAWRGVLEGVHDYCLRERDLRGHTGAKGWAHAAAHAADVLEELIRSRHADAAECRRAFEALASLVSRATSVYADEEDERISLALGALVETGKVPLSALIAWLDEELPSEDERVRRINWKHVVRSLFFRLGAQPLRELQARLVTF